MKNDRLQGLFKIIALVYLLYLVELLLLFFVNVILFKIQYPDGLIVSKLTSHFKEVFAWTLVFRTIYGYSLIFILTILLFKKKISDFTPLKVSIISLCTYLIVSFLYAFVLLPDTKEFLAFDMGYKGGFFYYTLLCLVISPFILNKIGVFNKLK